MDENFTDRNKVSSHRMLTQSIGQAEQLTLYRAFKRFGNPEPLPEEGIFKVNDVFQFRNNPTLLQSEDALRIKELCSDPDNFFLMPGKKMCVFSEDYCLEWRDGDATVRLLFCFSCGDIYIAQTVPVQILSLIHPLVFKEILSRY